MFLAAWRALWRIFSDHPSGRLNPAKWPVIAGQIFWLKSLYRYGTRLECSDMCWTFAKLRLWLVAWGVHTRHWALRPRLLWLGSNYSSLTRLVFGTHQFRILICYRKCCGPPDEPPGQFGWWDYLNYRLNWWIEFQRLVALLMQWKRRSVRPHFLWTGLSARTAAWVPPLLICITLAMFHIPNETINSRGQADSWPPHRLAWLQLVELYMCEVDLWGTSSSSLSCCCCWYEIPIIVSSLSSQFVRMSHASRQSFGQNVTRVHCRPTVSTSQVVVVVAIR